MTGQRIHRAGHSGGHFAQISNDTLRDEAMSWKATGILAYLLSLPDDWQVRRNELERHKTDGAASLRSGLAELRTLGYVRTWPERSEDGQVTGWVTEVRESLSIDWTGQPEADQPDVGFPHVDPQLVGNRTLRSTQGEEDQPNEHPESVFERFWQAYPQRTARKAAEMAFRVAVSQGADPEKVITAAEAYARFVSVASIELRWVPRPARWLDEGRWDDKLPAIAVADPLPGIAPRQTWELTTCKVCGGEAEISTVGTFCRAEGLLYAGIQQLPAAARKADL